MATESPACSQAHAQVCREAAAAFDLAKRAAPSDQLVQSGYQFADQHVRLRIVGCDLARALSSPFTHLMHQAPRPAAPRLTIDLWDVSATGIPGPRPGGTAGGEMRWLAEGGVLSASVDGRFVAFELDDAISWLDRAAGRIVGWRTSEAELSIFERGKPIPLLLPLWYGDHGISIIHAGLVSRQAKGVLIGGPGGAGKSTTAIACLQAGFSYLGDDHCGLEDRGDGSFVGHSLYSSTRLATGHMIRFPQLQSHAIYANPQPDEKALLLFSQVVPERLQRHAPIKVLILPRFMGETQPTRTRPARRGEALLRLSLSSLFMPLGGGLRAAARLAELVQHVPSFWLEYGGNVADIPAHIERVLDQTA